MNRACIALLTSFLMLVSLLPATAIAAELDEGVIDLPEQLLVTSQPDETTIDTVVEDNPEYIDSVGDESAGGDLAIEDSEIDDPVEEESFIDDSTLYDNEEEYSALEEPAIDDIATDESIVPDTSFEETKEQILASDTSDIESIAVNPETDSFSFDSVNSGVDGIAVDEINFPDTNFRNYVTQKFDTDQNGFLSATEVGAASYIDVDQCGIADLTGIAFFTSLERLSCNVNQLTSLDVSANTALLGLYCSQNQLTSLDLHNNTALQSLNIFSNQLTSLDVSANKALTDISCWDNRLTSINLGENDVLTSLYCNENQLSSLDLSGCLGLKYLGCWTNQLTNLELIANQNLETINVSTQSVSGVKLTETDGTYRFDFAELVGKANVDRVSVTSVTPADAKYSVTNGILSTDTALSSLTYAYSHGGPDNGTMDVVLTLSVVEAPKTDGIAIDEINFPDANFRSYVAQNCDKDQDGFLSTGEIASVKSIIVVSRDITDLRGLEHFTALQSLNCNSNKLTSLDVSRNTALVSLDCTMNKLTSLDVSANTALTSLDCGLNRLTNLDVRANTALTRLDCWNNLLTSLDVSANTALTSLSCAVNSLTSLDVHANTELTLLNCERTQLKSLDVSANSKLKTLICRENHLSSLDVSANTALTYLGCASNDLLQLDISNNTALTNLSCDNNQLASLDVSANSALTQIQCGYNQLSALDLSNNSQLSYIDCSNNHLTQIDLSARGSSTSYFGCNCDGQTALARLAERDGGYYLDFADIVGAENVGFVQVESVKPDDAKYNVSDGVLASDTALTGLTYFYSIPGVENTWMEVKLAFSVESADISIDETHFPDSKFRTYVSDYFDRNKDGFLSADELMSVTSIRVSDSGIADLTGIEYFTVLKMLKCSNNLLTNLNLSANTALTSVECYKNQLSSLNVNGCAALTTLYCWENQLTNLDLRTNTLLSDLTCSDNQLENLDITANARLSSVDCSFNLLKDLDLSGNRIVSYVNCDNNQLTTIDVSENKNLDGLYCKNNHLTSLNLWIITDCEGQTATAELAESEGTYRLDFATLVGTDNIDKVTVLSVTPADAEYSVTDGVLTTETALTGLVYHYSVVGAKNGYMDVTLTLTMPGSVEDGTYLENGLVTLYTDGEVDTSYSGLANYEGTWYYLTDGVEDDKEFGFVDFAGGQFLVANGTVATHINGLFCDPDDTAVWYFLSNGQAQTQYSGLALYDGSWFYLKDGILDTTFSGVVDYDGGKFLVGAGRIMSEVCGLCQDPITGTWYFFADGMVQDYTGEVEYGGATFHITHGVLDA